MFLKVFKNIALISLLALKSFKHSSLSEGLICQLGFLPFPMFNYSQSIYFVVITSLTRPLALWVEVIY